MKSKYLSLDELSELRAQMSTREFLPLAVSLETGMRIGDVLKIRLEDLSDSGVCYVAEKTGKIGFAEISPKLLAAMRGNASMLTRWVFPGRNPWEHLTRQAVWSRVKKACERAEMSSKGVSPHSMRKEFAVHKYRSEGAQSAQRALQHSRSDTTAIYIYADWTTGANAYRPILRKDLPMVCEKIVDAVLLALDNRKGL